MVDFVSGLNPNTPTYNDVVSDAAGHMRGIKQALKGTFPTFSEALNVGPEAINTYEGRIAALEAAYANLDIRKIESGIVDMLFSDEVYVVTGLGFTPSMLIATASTTGTILGVKVATGSYGFTDGTNQYCVGIASDHRAGNDTAVYSSGLLWQLYAAQGSAPPNDLGHKGVFTSFDADGFTITATTNSVNATANNRLLWTAFE